jgi:general stress protein YciG
MVGTREGGIKAAATNKQRYGEDFYMNIGRKGGQISRGGPFTRIPGFAKAMGSIGGRKSRRPKVTVTS